MDVKSLGSGTFDTALLRQIEARAHFIIILTPGTVERCAQSDDWLRREIEHAMDTGRNIVPLFVYGFTFNGTEKFLTGKLDQLHRYNGLPLDHIFFDDGMKMVRNNFLKPTAYPSIKPVPASDEPKLKQQQAEAAVQPIPTPSELSAEEYGALGYAKQTAGEVDGAIADYTEALRLNPNYDLAYYNRGLARSDKGDLDGAIADYTEAIRLNPQYAETYTNRGNARYEKGDLDGAIADHTEAIRLNPRLARAYYNRGLTRSDKGDLDGAIADYTEALRLNPQYAEAYNNRGNARSRKGDLDGATADYDEAIRLDPQYAAAYSYYNRGYARRRKGNLDGAIADYDEAIRLNPQYAAAYNNRGFAYYHKGDYASALADCSEAVRLEPNNAEKHESRAEVYFALENYAQALNDFRRALKLQPDFDTALAGKAITQHRLGQKTACQRQWKSLLAKDRRYRDADWVGRELNWAQPLIDAARELIAELDK